MSEALGRRRTLARGKDVPSDAERAEAAGSVRPIEEFPPADVVAIAIRRFADDWLHLGIVIRPDKNAKHASSDGISLLHLKQHYDLAWETIATGYYCVVPALPVERQTQVAVFCEVVRDRLKGKLPFAVKYKGATFDRSGRLVSKEGRGLTCATFVLAIFRSIGINLILHEEWPERQSDLRWHSAIVETLRKRGASKEHIAAVEAEAPCARYLPQEVAAAGTAAEMPISFKYAKPVGHAIRSKLPINPPPEKWW